MFRFRINIFSIFTLLLCLYGWAFSSSGQDYIRLTDAEISLSPVVAWNTFLGGTSYDSGSAVCVDTNGNKYVVGASYASWGSPIRSFSGSDDTFVVKLAENGAIQWTTFLGGGDHDYGYGVTVDGTGNIYVSGYSAASWGSPLRAYSGGDDAFVAKLNANGALQWNTFLGASGSDYGLSMGM